MNERKLKIQQEQIKRAIKKAIEYPYCVDAKNINIWHLEDLQRYNDVNIFRQVIGSYLK